MAEAVMSALDEITYGMSDITFEYPDGSTIVFDGKVTDDGKHFLQAEGAELSIKTTFNDIKTADTGESNLDDIVSGHEVTVKVTATQENFNLYKLAMAGVSEIKSTDSLTTVGLTDAALGTSNRKRAVKVTIHPRQYGASKKYDIVIYKAASKSDLNRTYKNEQGNYDIELQAYPRDGFDMSKPGNFYYMGEKDPNAVV